MAQASRSLVRAGVFADVVDVGGGFPSVYPGMVPPDLAEYTAAIDRGFADMMVHETTELWCEPGRALVAEASSLLTRVDLRKGDALSLNDGAYGSLFDAAHSKWPFPVKLVRDGEADAMVSSGNTGAGVLSCARTFSLMPGVRRAALATVYPTATARGEKNDPFSLILDVGATVDATADDLVAFAVMGSAYARIISKNKDPSVALLSNGTEAMKGPPRVVEANARLSTLAGVRFIGNIEGVDIPKGTADVVVCDGFVGNVCLKMLEGVSETVIELARYAYKEKLLWRAGLAMLSSGIERIKEVTDWEQYGGAPILGFDKLFIKAHGRSRSRAITNAGKVAAKAVSRDLTRVITEGLPKS
jgi:glycerol-3-phosphate acyltransferase PlsX